MHRAAARSVGRLGCRPDAMQARRNPDERECSRGLAWAGDGNTARDADSRRRADQKERQWGNQGACTAKEKERIPVGQRQILNVARLRKLRWLAYRHAPVCFEVVSGQKRPKFRWLRCRNRRERHGACVDQGVVGGKGGVIGCAQPPRRATVRNLSLEVTNATLKELRGLGRFRRQRQR